MGESLMAPDVGNPRGYYEDLDFYDFHVRVLAERGIDAFLVREEEVPLHFAEVDRARAVALLRRKGSRELWGWKEPRTTLFLDLWADQLAEPLFLLLFRHPFAVVDSLLRRGLDKPIVNRPIRGLRCWRVYNTLIEDFVRRRPRVSMLVEIDDLIADPGRVREAISGRLGARLDPVPFGRLFASQEFAGAATGIPRGLHLHPIARRRALALYERLRKLAVFSDREGEA